MNVILTDKTPPIDDDFADLAETAAVGNGNGKKSSFATPLDQVKRGFYQILLHSHAAFRVAMVSSLLNEKALTALDTSSVQDATGFDIGALAEAVAIGRLREWMVFKPGNGTSKPFELTFLENMYNIDPEVTEKLMTIMPKDALRGMPLGKFMDEVSGMGVQSSVASTLEETKESFQERYVDALDDLVNFVIRVERQQGTHADGKNDSLLFHFSIQTDGSVYKELVQADKFEPYLLYLWIHNALTLNDRSGVKIIDPRVAVEHNKSMTRFATVKPKVNERFFAIHGSGLPIFVPPNVNVVDKFLEAANSSINENGEFSPNILVEKYKFNNKIIYVDWINDIMAYTSNTGRLETINLGQISPLDQATEYNLLSTKLMSPALSRIRSSLSESISALDGPDAVKYASTERAKQVLMANSSNEIWNKVLLLSSTNTDDKIEDVCLKHLAGYDVEADFEKDVPRQDLIHALRALFKLLHETSKNDPDAIKISSSYKSQGLLFRLIGIEYVIQLGANMKVADVEKLFKAYVIEREKTQIDFTKKTFDIPNIKVGPGGLEGLLPHQGRVLSSTEKTPTTMMLPIQTGGGKTIVSAITAIKAIENIKTIPMITTKGNLVKGTVTELNSITGGKINAIPFRPGVIRAMKRFGVKTFAQFIAWYKNLPPNTILVNAYSDYASRRRLFEDLATVAGFGDAPVYTTQYLLIIKLLGIKMFIGDESHQIKNPDSARSRNSYTAFSQSDVRCLMSGTMVSNTVVDLVGQARAASPYIFGDNANAFAERFNISTGLLDDESARIIKERLRATTAYHEATREDWSYMLPMKEDDITFAKLTPLQTNFYNSLMLEAYLILLDLEKKKGGKKTKANAEDETSVDEDDEDDEDEDDDDEEEDEDAALIAKARTYLQVVEAFLVAPDENEQYLKYTGDAGGQQHPVPSGEDLVSPKVRAADALLEAHLASNKGDLYQNKVIIFGWNRVASQHFMRHSKFAGQALHYTAGDDEVMRRFETDPNAHIMCADEGSVREGFNLQMTSLILRMQSVWAPGDHEQTLARMYRPDPRGKYNRDSVRHVWIMASLPNGRPSLDAVKMARLISKSVSNARLTYEGRPEWRSVSNEFNEMELLKMRLDLIFNAKPEEIEPYFDHWNTFVRWENGVNFTAKRRLAEKLEAQFNVDLIKDGKIIDINKFITLAMSEVTSTKDIPGSKRVWVPWTANAIPADPKGWGFRVLGQQSVAVGTAVYTQFGPAVVESISGKSIKVRIYDGRVLGMKKNIIMLVADKKYKELAAVVKDPAKWQAEAMDVYGVKGNTLRVTEVIEDEEEVINLEEEDEAELQDFEVLTTIINGWPALMVMDDIPELKGISGWRRIDPFLTMSFRTWDTLDKFIDLLASKVYIDQATLDKIDDEIDLYKTGKALVLQKQIPEGQVRQFFAEQHKKLGKKNNQIVAKPYLIAVEKEIKLAFDINSHEARLISWLMKAKTNVPGVKAIKKNEAIWVNTFATVKEAFQDLENLEGIVKLDKAVIRQELVEIKDEILQLKKARSKPAV